MSVAIAQRPRDLELEDRLARAMHPLLARVFAARGIRDPDEVRYQPGRLLPVRSLQPVEAAARLLADALERRVPIVVAGDYDADGATATALLTDALRHLGAEVHYVMPNRFTEGYGLSPALVQRALACDPGIIVTVDSGIASHEGVRAAREAGVDVLVTDHHLPPKVLPDANVILSPTLPESGFGSRSLAGVGVAFYLVAALARMAKPAGETLEVAAYLDLVALGTLADVVPLDYNNRVLVRAGLDRICEGGGRPGIVALLEVAGRDPARVNADDMAFAAAPRINAAGRLDDMTVGVECLLAPDRKRAVPLAEQLDELNRARRELELDITASAVSGLNLADTDVASVCVYRRSWHQGVVGTVAGRLRERFNRPAIAFAPADDGRGPVIRGSARSVPELNIRDAIAGVAARQPGLVLAFGGHAMAAGLTLTESRFEPFRAAFEAHCRAQLGARPPHPTLLTDGDLPAEWISVEMARRIEAAGPFGAGFDPPLFDGLFEVIEARRFGKRREHVAMVLAHYGGVVDAVYFDVGRGPGQAPPEVGQRARIAYRLGYESAGGVATARLVVVHYQPL